MPTRLSTEPSLAPHKFLLNLHALSLSYYVPFGVGAAKATFYYVRFMFSMHLTFGLICFALGGVQFWFKVVLKRADAEK